jgi:phosphinothricin acetyltransferase
VSSQPHIRCATENDVDGILAIYGPFVAETPVSFETEIPSASEMWNRISSILTELPYLVCEIDGKIAGYAYASNFRQRKSYQWSKEVSVYVAPELRGRHIATGLYFSLIEILKKLGVANLLAGITVPNPASINFHESLGFRKCGEYTKVGYKLGVWHSVGWWELRLIPENISPQSLISFSEIKDYNFVKNTFSEGERLIVI